MGALENLIYGVKDVYATALATLRPRRAKVWFRNGFDVADDPDNDRTVVDAVGVGGGGTVPITDAAIHGTARDLTLIDHFDDAPDNADGCVVGSDRTFDPAKTVDILLLTANTEIQWAIVGASATMSCDTGAVYVVNGKPIGFLAGVDPSTLPASGSLRFPYNGGVSVPLVVVKDSGAADRQWLTFDTDTVTIGCAGITTVLLGSATSATTAGSVPVTPITEQGAAYVLATSDRGSVVVISGASVKLPAAPTTGDAYTVVNASGADMTVDLNGGPNIYGEAGNETVADAEARTYVYNGVSLNKWVRA